MKIVVLVKFLIKDFHYFHYLLFFSFSLLSPQLKYMILIIYKQFLNTNFVISSNYNCYKISNIIISVFDATLLNFFFSTLFTLVISSTFLLTLKACLFFSSTFLFQLFFMLIVLSMISFVLKKMLIPNLCIKRN